MAIRHQCASVQASAIEDRDRLVEPDDDEINFINQSISWLSSFYALAVIGKLLIVVQCRTPAAVPAIRKIKYAEGTSWRVIKK
jgi:hypothetical protein